MTGSRADEDGMPPIYPGQYDRQLKDNLGVRTEKGETGEVGTIILYSMAIPCTCTVHESSGTIGTVPILKGPKRGYGVGPGP